MLFFACKSGSTGMSFKIAIHATAGDDFIKIYQMAVKIGAIHTAKLSPTAYGEAAAAVYP